MLENTPSPSDAEIASRIQARDAAAFELLYQRYQEAIYRHLMGIVRQEAAAQDLSQEVFLRVWTRAEQWSGQGAFKGWLYRIATNLALNYLRDQRRRPAEPLRAEESSAWDEWSSEEELPAPGWLVDTLTPGPDAALEQAEQRAWIQSAVETLAEQKREVFRLVHEMELSIRDTAGRLGIPEGTVKSRLHYAEKQFEQAWQTLTDSQEDPP
jgi:RNA polymerase sigma-70 factor (ECF subfamily)